MTKSLKAKIGAHVSIAGGVFNAPARAAEEGCETFQCFTRSPQGGKAPELTEDVVAKFKEEMKNNKIDSFVIHAPYYINLASLKSNIKYGSISVLRDELERGSLLGASFVMFHPGSHSDQTQEEGIAKCIEGIHKILVDYKGSTELLIEISAGAGSVIGDTFEELGEIVSQVHKLPGFGGVCFDTCHAFASGYDYRTPEGCKKMLKDFDDKVGLKFLRMSHVNDSKTDLGGKKDRHEHIGDGFVGEEGIRTILQSEPFSKITWILETEYDKRAEDIEKLKAIRGGQ